MPPISKWLLLLAFFILPASLLAACSSPQSTPLTSSDALRATLSVLETTAARQVETSAPSETLPPVPLTGDMGPQANPMFPPPAVQDPALPSAVQAEPASTATSDPLITQIDPATVCQNYDAKVSLTTPGEAATGKAVKVGETVEVKIRLQNTGCVSLGLPQYRLAILNSEGKPIFSPDKPEPVIHSLSVSPGKTDEVTYTLQAVSAGKATLSTLVSFEVHLGYPGPATWGASGSNSLVIQVEK